MTRLPNETTSNMGGTQRLYRFQNGYGASVIESEMSYGQELAVLNYRAGGCLTYSTPITDDVIGHLTDEELETILDKIEALPPAPGAAEQSLLDTARRR